MEHAAFLRDILDHPHDDTPRLVYADWLLDQGDADSRARAELIRVQYALEQAAPDEVSRPLLEEVQLALLGANEVAWSKPLKDLGVHKAGYRRGFAEQVHLTAQVAGSNGNDIRNLAPVREVVLLDWWGTDAFFARLARNAFDSSLVNDVTDITLSNGTGMVLGALAGCTHLTRLAGLHLQGTASDVAENTLATLLPRLCRMSLDYGFQANAHDHVLTFEQLTGLDHLSLSGGYLDNDTLRALLRCPSLHRLLGLTLARSEQLSERGLQQLAHEPPGFLRALHLKNLLLDRPSLLHLTGGSLIASVRHLEFSGCRLGADGVEFLARNPLPRLESLDLSSNQLGSQGAAHLSWVNHWPALHTLSLRSNHLGDDGVRRFISGPLIEQLSALHLRYNRITAFGLGAAPLPSTLSILDLSWNPLGDEGAIALAGAKPSGLQALDLGYCEIGDAGLVALAACEDLEGLRNLNLGTNRVGDAGLMALAQSSCLENLEGLNLAWTNVTDVGIKALLQSPLFSRLRVLSLAGTRVSEDVRRSVRQQFQGILG